MLCVDLDPQGNLSDYFDVPADADPTIADVLGGRRKATEALYDGVLPANLGLAEAELDAGRQDGPRADAQARAQGGRSAATTSC